MVYDNLKFSMDDLSPLEKSAIWSLEEQNCIGESKKAARDEANDVARKAALESGMSEADASKLSRVEAPGIYGTGTYIEYCRESCRFAAWVEEVHPGVWKIKYARRYVPEYIQMMIKNSYSASTIAMRVAALAKLYRCSSADFGVPIPPRHYADFTRSRGYCDSQYELDVEKHGDIAVLCRCIGVRECELEHLYPECFITDNDGNIYCHLDGKAQYTKGGKTRDVVILPSNQEVVSRILGHSIPGELICPKAPSHLDIHGIRSLYATDYYAAIARDVGEIPTNERIPLKHAKIDNSRPGQHRTSSPGIYTRRSDGKKFDRKALLIVSASLGHNREDVVVHSYLR
jgi:hypothetical protein